MGQALALHCELTGSGPDLVLLHPAGLDARFMSALTEAAAATHRVIGIDLRGHGRSPGAPAGSTLADHAADVHAAIRAHCEGPALVAGLSLGGMVAQMLALQHPQSVRALVLCGCTGTFAEAVRPLLRERGLAAERGGMAAVVDATLERWFTPGFLADPAVAAVRERLLRDEVSNWSATWQAIAGFDALPRLGEVHVPTLVLAGERDAATPVPATEALAAAIPGARHVVLPGAPHMMQIETGTAFARAVLRFLAAVEPCARR
jgi:3-oxoadipate enol-lactonase